MFGAATLIAAISVRAWRLPTVSISHAAFSVKRRAISISIRDSAIQSRTFPRVAIGAAERALEAMCRRAVSRVTFGQPIAMRGNIQDWIAESRIEIEMTRLLTLKAAWLMDTVGNRHARVEIAAIKVAAPNVALKVLDRAIQVFGGAGVTEDFGLAWAYAHLRTLRLADGPDEVHKLSIARRELEPYKPREPSPA